MSLSLIYYYIGDYLPKILITLFYLGQIIQQNLRNYTMFEICPVEPEDH